jgi:hypothetical protein
MRLVALYGFLTLTLVAQHVPVVNTTRGMIPPSNAYQYGNILFPGGIPPISNNHAGGLGATIAGGSYTGVAPGAVPQRGGRQRTVVVPYAYPVYYGGGYGGYDAPDQQPQNVTVVVPQQQVPQVIINNGYTPETSHPLVREYGENELPESTLRVYEGSSKLRTETASRPERSGMPQGSVMNEKPTIYLIALKDGTLRQAIGYWTQGDTLHYVTPDSSVNHLSIGMVDRERSIELNAERKLEFDLKLPR